MTHSVSEPSNPVTSEVSDDLTLLAELRTRWPVLTEPKPLKRGIRQDIRASLEGISGVRISRALLLHTSTLDYQAALAAGGPRFDLSGAPCGEIRESDQRRALAIQEGRARFAPPKGRKKPKRQKATQPPSQGKGNPTSPPIPAPDPAPAAPPPPEPPSIGRTGRPVLKLKPKASSVTTATVTRKEAKS